MKYVMVLVIGAFGGFVAAWLLFKSTTSDIPMSFPTQASMPMRQRDAATPIEPSVGSLQFGDIEAAGSVFDRLYLAWQLAAASDTRQLEVLINQAMGNRDPLFRDNIVSIFLERFVALDPQAAMAFVTADYRMDQAVMQGHVLTSWVRYDPERAIDYFTHITDQQIKMSIGARLLEDPVLARSGLLAEVEASMGAYADRVRQQIEMRRSDPVELFETALSMSGRERTSRLIYAVGRWAQQDPEAALARISQLPNASDRNQLLQSAIQRYAEQNADDALAYLQIHEPDNTSLALQVLATMARSDIARALPLYEDLARRSGNSDVLQSLVTVWANEDPVRAIAYVDTVAAEQREKLYTGIAYRYLQQQPEAGFNWLLSLPPEYEGVRRSTLQVVASRNVEVVEQALPRITDPRTRLQVIPAIAARKATDNPGAALQWLAAYQREPAYAVAYRNVISQLARQNPQEAARLIDTSIDGVGEMAGTIANIWYQSAPEDAISWTLSLPSADARVNAINNLVATVAGKDPDRAIDLLSTLPAGSVKERARANIAFSWFGRNPDQVEEIVSRLDLPDKLAAQLRNQAAKRGSASGS